MSRENTLMILGILVALSPFVGIPHSWLMIITPVLGLFVVIIGYTLRGRESSRAKNLSA